jgi:hypothetical protein
MILLKASVASDSIFLFSVDVKPPENTRLGMKPIRINNKRILLILAPPSPFNILPYSFSSISFHGLTGNGPIVENQVGK